MLILSGDLIDPKGAKIEIERVDPLHPGHISFNNLNNRIHNLQVWLRLQKIIMVHKAKTFNRMPKQRFHGLTNTIPQTSLRLIRFSPPPTSLYDFITF